MSQPPVTIPKQPVLRPAEDFYRLRREGIGFIEQMGSRLWTDYNLHDPGITMLEALAYAITDLAYRTGWEIEDLLAPAPGKTAPDQAFYTARKILTINPWTTDDFRRLLIDLAHVRNAWFFCKKCACDLHYFAWCDEFKQLQLSFKKTTDQRFSPKKIEPLGLYEALLELESDPVLGDLNNRKIEQTVFAYDAEHQPHALTLELRFPAWELLNQQQQDSFLRYEDASTKAAFLRKITGIQAFRFSRSNASEQTEADPFDLEVKDAELRRYWREVFYVSFKITFDSGDPLVLNNVAMRFFGDDTAKKALNVLPPADVLGFALKELLETKPAPADGKSATGFIQQYRWKLRKATDAVESAKAALHSHRNLDEDYCRVRRADVEDVAVCADVEVTPDADIERVQADIWFAIERYFNPPVPFYTLPELQEAGIPTEDIFNGPELESGFLKADELAASGLKTELRVSDLINLLMDIEGVRAVNNLQLTKYDAEGLPVRGAADLHAEKMNLNQISANWTLAVTPLHQPRLYFHLSRFLFYKNGLPFQARAAEALETLTQLRGAADRPKVPNAPKDLLVPAGTFRDPEDYYPVQYSLPRTYGVSPEGLPGNAAVLRRAQARQLKGYLMVFEQLLVNAMAQIANTAQLFSIDTTPPLHTYFTRLLDGSALEGANDLLNGLTASGLQELAETTDEFLERRNRFLNHLLSRFGEQFGEYALLLTARADAVTAQQELIADKLAFLTMADKVSHDRGKAFDYHNDPTNPANVPGLRLRLRALLGIAPGDDAARFIIVEHLLLRPKFHGDALYPACVDGGCSTCSDAEDPYSFRLTYVMTGWVSPFDTDLEMRHFADRTIRQETPAHLLPKICWVGNDGFTPDPCDPVLTKVADLLTEDHATDIPPDDACVCAVLILNQYNTVFKAFFDPKKTAHLLKTGWESLLQVEFAPIVAADFPCSAAVDATTWDKIQVVLLAHFTEIAYYGWQFERFEEAWKQWLEVNKVFDWTEERLADRVEAMLVAGLAPKSNTPPKEAPCQWAVQILTHYGMKFFEWMKAKLDAGAAFDNNTWVIPDPAGIVLPAGFLFKPGTAAAIEAFLEARYEAYKEVSYRLWIVLDLLSKLRNAYPGATLHDCDDGSDDNPVRLGSTALGRRRVQAKIVITPAAKAAPAKPVATQKKTEAPKAKSPATPVAKSTTGPKPAAKPAKGKTVPPPPAQKPKPARNPKKKEN
jgi:hypothetical protein